VTWLWFMKNASGTKGLDSMRRLGGSDWTRAGEGRIMGGKPEKSTLTKKIWF